MSLFHNPISKLSLPDVGVSARNFLRQSTVHDCGHTNRVIFHALRLARLNGESHMSAAVWAAAHLHDQARRHDGPCNQHGLWAVQEILPILLPFYVQAGLRYSDIPAVAKVVEIHCTGEELPVNHPYYKIWSLLVDADAIDRVRFGGPDQVDFKRLHSERAFAAVYFANDLYEATKYDGSWINVWNQGIKLNAPQVGISKTIPVFWDENETPCQRRNRRIAQGALATKMPIIPQAIWNECVPADEALIELVTRFNHRTPSLIAKIKQRCAELRPVSKRLIAITYTNFKQEFERDDIYKDFWHSGISWQSRFTDLPEDTRSFCDAYLYGERGDWVSYASLIDPEKVDLNVINFQKINFGREPIIWRNDILKDCSFCLNDSQRARRLLPFHPETWIKAAIATELVEDVNLLPLTLVPWDFPSYQYWEVQIHQKLTLNDTMPIDMQTIDQGCLREAPKTLLYA